MTGTWTAGKGCSSGFRFWTRDRQLFAVKNQHASVHHRGLGYRLFLWQDLRKGILNFRGGFIWPRMETVGAPLWRQQWTFVFHKSAGRDFGYWGTTELVSQVRPSAIELCIYRKSIGFLNMLHAKNTLIERSFKPELEWRSALWM